MGLLFLSQPFPKITRKHDGEQTNFLSSKLHNSWASSSVNRQDLLKLTRLQPLTLGLLTDPVCSPGSFTSHYRMQTLISKVPSLVLWVGFCLYFLHLCVAWTLPIALQYHACSSSSRITHITTFSSATNA